MGSPPSTSAASTPAPAGPSRRARDEPQPANGKVSRRRISHISKACNGCRRRKMKCDGVQPSCSICKIYKEECVYNAEADGRRSAPKAYVASLEEKIRVLEGVLNAHGIDEQTPMPEAKTERTEPVVPVDSGERLKIDEETGELLECGPTSLFSHKPEQSDRSPADSLGGSGSAAERPALLHPRPSVCPELGAPELDNVLHQEVLRLFFEYFNTQCFWVNERGFKRDLASAPGVEGTIIHARRTAYYSPMLHNVVLSVGVLMLPIERVVRGQLGLAFARRAKDLIEEESEAPMMSTVSALMLLGTYHAATGRQNLGFLYSGMGLRLVQALGLGTNCSFWVRNGSITEEQQMGRYHLFYAAYVLDKCWSTYVGRGASMTLSNYDVPVPEPTPEEDDVPWQPMLRGAPSPHSTHGSQDWELGTPVKGWRSTTWAWTCRLATIAERVLGTVYSIGFSTTSANVRHVVSDLDVRLEKWLDEIPDVLRLPKDIPTSNLQTQSQPGSPPQSNTPPIVPSHILALHALHCFMLILLHRPWFAQLRPGSSDQTTEMSVAKCERAASKVVQIVNFYERCPGLRYSPITLNQIVFSAGTVHLLCASRNSGRKARASVDAVRTCISALHEMGDTLECAALSAKTLQGLLDDSDAARHAPRRDREKEREKEQAKVDIEKLIQDPAVADQLRQLGWAPPLPTVPASCSSMATLPVNPSTSPHTSTVPLTATPGPRGHGIDFDWFTTPTFLPMSTSPNKSTHVSAIPPAPTPVAATPGAVTVPGAETHTPPEQLADLLQLNPSAIYDVLYAGAPTQAFPSGNLWSFGFGFGGPGSASGTGEQPP